MSHERPTVAEVRSSIEATGAAWQAGTTPLTDLSLEEKLLHLGYEPGPNQPSLAERERMAVVNLTSRALTTPALADRLDLRDVGGSNFITPVKDQGPCGSCVAFGTIAAIEGTLRMALRNPDLDVDYSEAHLFYCHARREGRTCDGPSKGWWVDRALDAVKRSGVADERCYPYVPGDQSCANLCGNSNARLTFIRGWRRYVTPASMKAWLSNTGPLIACFSVYADFQDCYHGGVYRHVAGELRGGHCVCVVGYDDIGKYWICKNSWGPNFGEQGFFRIAYGECGIDAEMWTVEGVRSPSPAHAAEFVSQSLPTSVAAGQTHRVRITMRNTGIQAWTPERQYRLGAQNPQDNMTWGLGRVPVPGTVAPWQEADFVFDLTVPKDLPAHIQWRMLQEGVEWFGDHTPDVVPAQAGTVVRYGTVCKVRHDLSGRSLHSHAHRYRHPKSSRQQQVTCYAGADANDLWRLKGPHGQPDDIRAGQPVQHGDVVRLEHVLTGRNLHSHCGFPSPVTGQQEVTCFGEKGVGDGNDNWRVEVEGGGIWEAGKKVRLVHLPTEHALHSHLGHAHPEWTLGQQEVTAFRGRDGNDLWHASDFLPRDAQFVTQSVPAAVVAGQHHDMTVTMRNVGSETWRPGVIRLGSQSPQDNLHWGLGRVELPAPVPPGGIATFTFRVTAPAKIGNAHFQWRMVQDGVEWFGDHTPQTVVQVHSTAGPTTVPDVIGLSRTAAAAKIRDAELVPVFGGATGSATEVVRQTPTGGTTAPRGSRVELRMARVDVT
ncbi:C1 family peptidase [Saccharothrix variisporea]|uniref:PASTA domain-containing protein n=1 Tax=Saccharothrix variisporea TaxID=543527 RepID=A0A495XKE7_9PSEU|nr:C1 family peptidase [Saccharothrix variisporea]RKT74362.1 PASTA domain-containing protein [Saccharothrix variisporea]